MAQQPGPSNAAFRWEGDATLHSYTYDYMKKRGWNEAASLFAREAGIDEAAWTGPPIEAPQGLLYEWWSVFWDVFIARSQKAGPRNPNADAYVEAMRAKREPLSVSFAGPTPSPSMSLPRSLAHPPRLASNPQPSYGPPGGPPRAVYNQMHVLEQQELQSQMQQRGRVHQLQGQAGSRPLPPGVEPGYPPGAVPQRVMQVPQQQQQYGHPAPMAAHQQGHHLGQVQQSQGGPPSAHSSPQLVPASHSYANGRPPEQQGAPGGLSPAFSAAMAAVGLAGRDPESLSGEEHAAVAAQMRRMGALPPTMQNPALRQLSPQQQQQQQQQQQMVMQGRVLQQPPQLQRMPSDPQTRMYFPPQQQQQQQQQQQHQQQFPPQQQRMMQYSQGPPPPNAASPASPAYTSPYSTPHVAHMQIPSQQQPMHGMHSSPQADFAQPPLSLPVPPVARGAGTQGKKPGPHQQGAKGSPAANGPAGKRGAGPGGIEDPSPRTRKRPRPGTRGGEDDPGTPAYEQPFGGAGSPAAHPQGQMFAQDQGAPPYRPSPSPGSMQPPPLRKLSQQQQQMYVTGPPLDQHHAPPGQQQYLGGNSDANGGSMGMNGGGGPPHGGMVNGNMSRPASAMSNHHMSPGGPHQHFSPNLGAPPGPEQRASPIPPQMQTQMHMQMQQHGGGGGGRDDMSGVRPFAGPQQPHSATTTPLPPPPQQLPPVDMNGMPGGGSGGPGGAPPNGMHGGPDGSLPFNLSGDDMFSGLDFDTFLNNDMFAEDAAS